MEFDRSLGQFNFKIIDLTAHPYIKVFHQYINEKFLSNVNYKGKLFEYCQSLNISTPNIYTNPHYNNFISYVYYKVVNSKKNLINDDVNTIRGSIPQSKIKLSEQFLCYEIIKLICESQKLNKRISFIDNDNIHCDIITLDHNKCNTINPSINKNESSNILDIVSIDGNKVVNNEMKYLFGNKSDSTNNCIINVSKFIINEFKNIINNRFSTSINYKGKLFEYIQKLQQPIPIITTKVAINNQFISQVNYKLHDSIVKTIEGTTSQPKKILSEQMLCYELMKLICSLNNAQEIEIIIFDNEHKPVLQSSNYGYLDSISPRIDPLTINTLDQVFDLNDICSSTVSFRPRKSQLEVYYHMITVNTIVVMPTGSGKTFPASLAMARYRKCNKNKLSVMIVDRIPLVDQQARAINQYTGMNIYQLSSANSSNSIWQNFKQNNIDIDGLVATAGAINNLLNYKYLSLSDISIIIFDECHHVTGEHIYSKLVRLIQLLPNPIQPRIIGLSASPTEGLSEEEVISNLESMKSEYGDCILFQPKLDHSGTNQSIDWRKVVKSIEQQSRSNIYHKQLYSMYNEISSYLNVNEDTYKKAVYQDKDKGIIIYLSKRLIDVNQESLGSELLQYVYDIQDNDYFGINVLDKTLDSSRTSYSSCLLTALVDEINRYIEDNSTRPSIIIFVQDTRLASNLTSYMKKLYCNFTCERINGHSSQSNSVTIAQQKEIIKRFNEGLTHILISTSVIEEGLNVSRCNLVIRYGPKGSLIQFLQSRGRARSEDGKMIVLLYEEDYNTINKIERKEQSLTDAIKDLNKDHRIPNEVQLIINNNI